MHETDVACDVFISYASEDRERIIPIIELLQEHGWSVWWDHSIPPGRTFDEVIEEAIDAAKCVVVVWTKTSVRSRWVKTEASEGNQRRILVPVQLDPVRIPLEFRRIQASQLMDWAGDFNDPEAQKLVQSISTILGTHPNGDKPFNKKFKSILWVDDIPKNNTYLIEQITKQGVSVDLALSTSEGIGKFERGKYRCIISDMGRTEEGTFKPSAGLELIREIRKRDRQIPIYISTNENGVRLYGDAAVKAGATAVTSSQNELAVFITVTAIN